MLIPCAQTSAWPLFWSLHRVGTRLGTGSCGSPTTSRARRDVMKGVGEFGSNRSGLNRSAAAHHVGHNVAAEKLVCTQCGGFAFAKF